MATCSRSSTLTARPAVGPYQSNRKRFGDHARLLPLVDGQRAHRGTGAGVATRIGDFATEKGPQSRLNETPGTHVLGFLLAPNHFGRLWKRLEHRAQFCFGERIQLLDANDGGVVDLLRITIIPQIVINFARAKDDTFSLVGRSGL